MTRGRFRASLSAGLLTALSLGIVRADVNAPPPAARVAPSPELPQNATIVGMGNCATSKCHVDEAAWAQRLDGDGTGKRSHLNALNQLAQKQYPQVVKYVAAMNGKSAYSTPACLECHATSAPGDIEGVTCEKCHGPGSRYKDIHADEKKPASAYVSLGMNDYSTRNRWAGLCYGCHVLGPAKYQALVDAGHPSGADFDLTKKFDIVQGRGAKRTHWKKPGRVHTPAQVAAFAGSRPTAATVRALAPATATPAPSPTPAAPSSAPPTPSASTPAPTPPAPSPAALAPPTPAVIRDTLVPPPPVSRPVPPPARITPPALAAVTTTAAPRGGPPAAPVPSPQAPPPPTPVVVTGPRTVSAVLATVQGRVISVLASLLGQEVSVPQRVVPPKQPPNFTGPDAELLRLQYDVIALALELLGSAPPKGGK